jgi:hypothetical protein
VATRRRELLEALFARVQAIATTNLAGNGEPFATDLGQNAHLGVMPQFGQDDPDVALVVMPDDDSPGYQGENVVAKWPIHVAVVAKVSIDEPWQVIEDAIGDIKRAVETADRMLGGKPRHALLRGPTRAIPREPGSLTVGASVTYIVTVTEKWGDP